MLQLYFCHFKCSLLSSLSLIPSFWIRDIYQLSNVDILKRKNFLSPLFWRRSCFSKLWCCHFDEKSVCSGSIFTILRRTMFVKALTPPFWLKQVFVKALNNIPNNCASLWRALSLWITWISMNEQFTRKTN